MFLAFPTIHYNGVSRLYVLLYTMEEAWGLVFIIGATNIKCKTQTVITKHISIAGEVDEYYTFDS